MVKYRTPKRKPEKKTGIEQLTKAELTKIPDSVQIYYPHNANKATLVELVKNGGIDV